MLGVAVGAGLLVGIGAALGLFAGSPRWPSCSGPCSTSCCIEPRESTVAARVLLALVSILVPMHFVMPYFVETGLLQLLRVLAGIALAGSYASARQAGEGRARRAEALAPAQ
jgi:hypothetical protein